MVLDTNVLLSALLFAQGRMTFLREGWQVGRLVPLVSRPTVQELVRVLAYPRFELSGEDRDDLLSEYLPYCETVIISSPPPAVPICRDPFDRPFLELAIGARADFLVTGDKDLLALAGIFRPPIITAEELRQRLG